jgi:hypothetical protein
VAAICTAIAVDGFSISLIKKNKKANTMNAFVKSTQKHLLKLYPQKLTHWQAERIAQSLHSFSNLLQQINEIECSVDVGESALELLQEFSEKLTAHIEHEYTLGGRGVCESIEFTGDPRGTPINLGAPFPNTSFGGRGFCIAACNIWNDGEE